RLGDEPPRRVVDPQPHDARRGAADFEACHGLAADAQRVRSQRGAVDPVAVDVTSAVIVILVLVVARGVGARQSLSEPAHVRVASTVAEGGLGERDELADGARQVARAAAESVVMMPAAATAIAVVISVVVVSVAFWVVSVPV